MSCTSPCLTCISNNFYSCLTCDTSISESLTLNNNLCQINPTWYIQIAGTCMLAVFLFFPLLRKRSMVLIRIFDIVQFASYFKYINGFLIYRHNYIYLDMRSIPPWYEGFSLFSVSGDRTIPIFTTQETHINKLARIFAIWIGLLVAMVGIGLIKTFCGDAKMQLSKFVSKNIINTISIAFYFTIQDITFFCAQNFYRRSFNSTIDLLLFVSAIILSLISILFIRWQFNIINYNYREDKQNKLYNYQVMFMYRMDYDLFQTYKLTNLPCKEKTIYRYSNIIIINILYKIGYALLIASYLFRGSTQANDQIYSIMGLLLFYWFIWYISLPFDAKNQYLQLTINILADLICLALLVIPILSNSNYFNFVYMLIALSLYGLAILSAFLQVFLNIYSFLPYDLYDIGLKIVIQDKQLKQQLQRRKRQQQFNEKKLKQLHEQNQRINKLLLEKRQTVRVKQTEVIQKNKNQSEHSLQNEQRKHNAVQQIEDKRTNEQKFAYPIEKIQEKSSQNDDQLQKYRIDLHKKRRVYEFDKKKPFVYSNKLDLQDQSFK